MAWGPLPKPVPAASRAGVLAVRGTTILKNWISAEDLPALNASIVTIPVTAEYH